jgi:predicted benzoate:H+ symporter BenE
VVVAAAAFVTFVVTAVAMTTFPMTATVTALTLGGDRSIDGDALRRDLRAA